MLPAQGSGFKSGSVSESVSGSKSVSNVCEWLSVLGNRGYSVREEAGEYRTDADDTDSDSDTDPEKGKLAMPTGLST